MIGRHRLCAAVCLGLVCCWLSGASVARAEAYDTEQTSAAYDGVVGFGAALCTFVYAPVKLTYALTGSIVSGLAYLVTFDSGVAGSIIRPAVGGDYVVTPANLEGREPLHFIGSS